MTRFPSAIRTVCFQLGESLPNNGASSCRVAARGIQTESDKIALRPPFLPSSPRNGNWTWATVDDASTRRNVDMLLVSKFRALPCARRNHFLHLRKAIPSTDHESIQQMRKCVLVYLASQVADLTPNPTLSYDISPVLNLIQSIRFNKIKQSAFPLISNFFLPLFTTTLLPLSLKLSSFSNYI